MAESSLRPPDEQERLAALAGYHILDTAPEVGFDDIVMLARIICHTPIALISLVETDRQWFKAVEGLAICETPIDQSVCRHALMQPETMVIPDLTLDPRTKDNTLVTRDPFIRFYAGALLATPDGVPIGTVCVIDTRPRPEGLTVEQIAALEALARQVMSLLELRRTVETSERTTVQQRRQITEFGARADEISRVADSLRVSEGRMRLAQRAGHVGSFDIDLTNNTITVTEQFCDIFGLDGGSMQFDAALVENMVIDDDQPIVSKKHTRHDGSAPLDVEYRIRRADTGDVRWIARRGQFVRNADGRQIRLLGTVQDVTERKKSEAQQKIVNEELSHRLKNTLALVQAIARQTLRNASDRASVRAFEERVNALSHAHDILLRQNWASADLRDIVTGILSLHGDSGGRFRLFGPSVSLGSRAALSFSLLLHELATNAQKYGALSASSGTVEVAWSVADNQLEFRWIERGGPPVAEPTRIGLGTRLIDMGMMGTSRTVKRFNVSGLEVDMIVPLDTIQDRQKQPSFRAD